MNVLLINSNLTQCGRSGYPITPPPVGLISIAGVLKQHGHKVKICQICMHVRSQDEEKLPLLREELKRILSEFPADIIGISARNIGAARKANNSFHLVEYYSVFYDARIVRAFKMISNAPIVMGGTAFSIEPGLYMKYAKPDYGIIGEGEYAMLSLIENLESGEDNEEIIGLIKNYHEAKSKNKNYSRVRNLADIGVGASDVVDNFCAHYYESGGFAPIQTKRGCAMNCIYCTTPFLEGNMYRFRPIPHIIEEIRAYKELWGLKYFFFVDGIFNHPMEWAMGICNAIIEAKLDIKWYADLTPYILSDKLCKIMVDSGCIGLAFSPDSMSKPVIEAYNKNFGIGEIVNAIKLLKKYNIPFNTYIIVGGPGETMNTFLETLSFCYEHLKSDPVSFYDGMIVNTQTSVFKIAVKEDIIDPLRPYEDIVLKNDFKAMKGYEYFFPSVKNGRKEFLKLIGNMKLCKHWLVTGCDYSPDPRTGEFATNSNIMVQEGIRPWWLGLMRTNSF